MLAPVAHGAVPLVGEGLRKMLGMVPLKVLMIGHTLAVGGAEPAGIDAVLEESGAAHWTRHVMPPVRMQFGPSIAEDGRERQALVLGRPTSGQDLQWLVGDGCALDPDVVAQALSERLCGVVTARAVEALDPRDDSYRRMTLVRVVANCAGAMAALMAAGPTLTIAGEAALILP